MVRNLLIYLVVMLLVCFSSPGLLKANVKSAPTDEFHNLLPLIERQTIPITTHLDSCGGVFVLLDTTKKIDTTQIDTLVASSDKQKLTFWQKYIEPTLVVLSAAAVTILLFSVRSK